MKLKPYNQAQENIKRGKRRATEERPQSTAKSQRNGAEIWRKTNITPSRSKWQFPTQNKERRKADANLPTM